MFQVVLQFDATPRNRSIPVGHHNRHVRLIEKRGEAEMPPLFENIWTEDSNPKVRFSVVLEWFCI